MDSVSSMEKTILTSDQQTSGGTTKKLHPDIPRAMIYWLESAILHKDLQTQINCHI